MKSEKFETTVFILCLSKSLKSVSCNKQLQLVMSLVRGVVVAKEVHVQISSLQDFSCLRIIQ